MSGKEYWRSLEDRADTPEFREFLEREISGDPSQWLGPTTRRSFFKLMGASLSLAGLQSCRWPAENVLPFAARPTGRIEGVPQFFATSMDVAGSARGLLVKSYDGRPIKIEGNPIHPINRGATDSATQGAILEMYDPDRSRTAVRRDGREDYHAEWTEFDGFAGSRFSELRAARGRGLAILTEESTSPTQARLLQQVRESMPEAKVYEYEPLARSNARRGSVIAFGDAYRAVPDLGQAALIVSFDDDFLSSHPASVGLARDWAAGRQAQDGRMNRMVVVEASYSLTGAAADRRFAVATSKVGRILAAVAAEVAGAMGGDAGALALKSHFDSLAQGAEPHEAVTEIAQALVANRGHSIVMVGPRHAAEYHAIACWLNQALGNVGATLRYLPEAESGRPTHLQSIQALSDDLATGAISTLVILGGNPVYDAPADLDFAAKMAKAEQRIHLSLYDNETSEHATWHLPRAHFLEAWGDAEAWDGTYCAQQPLIEPLFGGRSSIELLALMVADPHAKGYDLVRATYQAVHGGEDFESAWRHFLHDGVAANSTRPQLTPEVGAPAIAENLARFTPAAGSGFELVFQPDYKLFDGRFANNGWLQESPDPLTKVTWDNAALVAPTDAAAKNLKTGELASIEVNGRKLDIVVYIMPGQAPGTIGLALGYGRTKAGRVGNGVGFDTYRLRGTDGFGYAMGASIAPLGKKYKLASTQDHFMIDKVGLEERQHRIHELVREGSLEDYRQHPEFAKHMGPHYEPAPLWQEHVYDGHKWGLSIDLTSCIGCGACVVACVAENNLPIVGKDQVRRGREMHWIRIDRYFRGGIDAPQVSYQPVTCHQCENAPCEQVCPVAATVHSHEGLNDQVYNRCIGTRYCGNNCPYKVRRFNYFNYQRHLSPLEKMHFNPEVTVRARGVMEKCTYCVQRINAVKIEAKNDQRPITDGEIQTACAQACPTRAITFGDLNDPASQVKAKQEHPRAYAMLAELHVRPRTQYLARLRNVEGSLAGGHGGAGGHEGGGEGMEAPSGSEHHG